MEVDMDRNKKTLGIRFERGALAAVCVVQNNNTTLSPLPPLHPSQIVRPIWPVKLAFSCFLGKEGTKTYMKKFI